MMQHRGSHHSRIARAECVEQKPMRFPLLLSKVTTMAAFHLKPNLDHELTDSLYLRFQQTVVGCPGKQGMESGREFCGRTPGLMRSANFLQAVFQSDKVSFGS